LPAKSSAFKRHRQSQGRRVRNKMVKTRVRTSGRKLIELAQGTAKEETEKQYKTVAGLLDRAVSKGIIHKNTAARKKRRLHKLLSGGKKAS
jgi:small subunit ribosomal protein S20